MTCFLFGVADVHFHGGTFVEGVQTPERQLLTHSVLKFSCCCVSCVRPFFCSLPVLFLLHCSSTSTDPHLQRFHLSPISTLLGPPPHHHLAAALHPPTHLLPSSTAFWVQTQTSNISLLTLAEAQLLSPQPASHTNVYNENSVLIYSF